MPSFEKLDIHSISWGNVGEETEKLLQKLFPIVRSITGKGVRQTLSILREVVDFDVRGIPPGTVCYDWKIPPEWTVWDAHIKDSSGNRRIRGIKFTGKGFRKGF